MTAEKSGGVIGTWGRLAAQLRKDSGVTFRLHDLRRTCRTLMSRLGIDRDTAELAIGHKRAGLEASYNLDEAWQRRCEAFAKVSNHVAARLRIASAEGKVVALPARS